MTVAIAPADLSAPAFAALVDRHAAFCDATAPAGSCHRPTLDDLRAPDMTVWQAMGDGALLGMAALKALDARNGEVKSMHAAAEARGRGVGRALLRAVLAEARARGYDALWLETGAHPGFAAARALYAASGFSEAPPFGDYVEDPHSVFMARRPSRAAA